LTIAFDARFQKAPGLEINEVPDGYVVYQADKERVHFLNTTAAALFELCDGEHSLADIVAIFKDIYGLETGPEAALAESAENLVTEGLILPCTG
jgi:hypothetical protein